MSAAASNPTLGNGEKRDRRIRVLFLTSLLDTLGGSEKNIAVLVRHLPRDRFESYVFALKGGETLNAIKAEGVYGEEVGLDAIFSLRGLVKGIALLRFLRERKIDILVTYHEDADLWGGVIGRLARLPVLLSSKRDMGYQINRKQRLAYRVVNGFFHRYVAVSEAVKREIARTQDVPESKFEVIYSGIAMNGGADGGKTRYVHDLLGVPRGRRLVGMVASFRPVKGQEFFVRAAARVLERFRDVEFVIVGSKETAYFDKVWAIVQELGIGEKVHCLGNRNDVPLILPSLDVFVLSSLHEGFSNALLEAMATGLPVIAPASGGNPEIVDANTGILFLPGDAEDLAKAVLRLLENDGEARELGRRAKERVRSRFSVEGMIGRYERLFVGELERARS